MRKGVWQPATTSRTWSAGIQIRHLAQAGHGSDANAVLCRKTTIRNRGIAENGVTVGALLGSQQQRVETPVQGSTPDSSEPHSTGGGRIDRGIIAGTNPLGWLPMRRLGREKGAWAQSISNPNKIIKRCIFNHVRCHSAPDFPLILPAEANSVRKFVTS